MSRRFRAPRKLYIGLRLDLFDLPAKFKLQVFVLQLLQ
jgi:hypothetical protein